MVIISNKINSRGEHDISILRRSFAKFSADDFNDELQDQINDFLDMNIAINETNVDELFNEFHLVITQTIDIHAPLAHSLPSMFSKIYPWGKITKNVNLA